MDIGYVWDEAKYEEIQRAHRVLFWEVVSTFDDPDSLEEPDPQGHWDRYLSVGRTSAGRLLQVLYEDAVSEEGSPLYRIITAFDAGKEWIDEYQRSR